jgi:hypothetical protein
VALHVPSHYPKRTNCESYQEDVQADVGVIPQVTCLLWDVTLTVDMVQQAIVSCCHYNWPDRVAFSPGWVPWWNKCLSCLKALKRWVFSQAKRTYDWELYKAALNCYNTEIRKAEKLMLGNWGCTWQCQTHEDDDQSVSQPTGWVVLNCLKAYIQKLEKETREELCRFYFLGSCRGEVNSGGQTWEHLQQGTLICSKCGAAECLSKGLRKSLETVTVMPVIMYFILF